MRSYFKDISNQVMNGLMLGIVVFNICINHLEIGINNMLMEFEDDIKGAASMHNERWINDFESVWVRKNELLLKKSDEYNWYNFLQSYSMEGKISITNVQKRI